ncbi:TetR family transcriptional regulator [Sediminihabitans luteus]|uniref:TetR family transcriptional regulator n=1 Tax=Sediminihabitans luteus TaxID=1138585 RepID=A0A2M9D0F7_9CELL|nr:TetR/AcrR family transcriptional regulator [Sediminihabitans luteus]PJJ77666.1 TetR family transcriptional regulator [Sediminihabitans luteus]GII98566.1 hypothetical protein Slu03_09440 [Sediminihabitans luteus]
MSESPSESAPGTPAGPRPTRRYAKGQATCAALVAAAGDVFGEVGYHGASLRDIAARAQISHPGLLHHYPTKADLLAAVLARRDEVDDAAIDADLAAGVDFFEALVRLVERNAARPRIVELFAVLSTEATSPDHPANGYFRARYARSVATVAAAVEARVEAGALAPGTDATSIARAVVALLDGLQVQWLLERSGGTSAVDAPAVDGLPVDGLPVDGLPVDKPAVDMAAEVRAHLQRLGLLGPGAAGA